LSTKFTVAVLTGGKRPHHIISNAIKSINSQTFRSIQPILINNGRSSEELNLIQTIHGKRSSLVDWEVIQMGKNTYDSSDLTSVWGNPGEKLLNRIEGDLLFIQNDDDFLHEDFFQSLAASFEKYPSANTAFGTVRKWDWQNNSIFGNNNNNYLGRPEIESGQNLFNRVIVNNDIAYGYNPGISFVCKSDLVKLCGIHFFKGGLPDFPPMMQIVPTGETIFDRNAIVFYGVHSNQQRHDWNRRNVFEGIYYNNLNKFKLHNISGARLCKTYSDSNYRAINNYFLKNQVNHAVNSVVYLVSNYRVLISSPINFIKLLSLHLKIIMKLPLFSLGIAIKHLKVKFNIKINRLS